MWPDVIPDSLHASVKEALSVPSCKDRREGVREHLLRTWNGDNWQAELHAHKSAAVAFKDLLRPVGDAGLPVYNVEESPLFNIDWPRLWWWAYHNMKAGRLQRGTSELEYCPLKLLHDAMHDTDVGYFGRYSRKKGRDGKYKITVDRLHYQSAAQAPQFLAVILPTACGVPAPGSTFGTPVHSKDPEESALRNAAFDW
jgi:hypothetical protein